nr:type II toxin-antitoxin system RelE/ParE family toxin [uncultured Methanolobus sp.]
MSYRVEYTEKARKELYKLPPEVSKQIILSVNDLKDNPFAAVKKLKGTKRHPLYTHMVGEYRVILDILNDRLLILILEMGHRSKIYRKY